MDTIQNLKFGNIFVVLITVIIFALNFSLEKNFNFKIEESINDSYTNSIQNSYIIENTDYTMF